MCPYGRAPWRHLANTIEPSVCCGDVSLCEIPLVIIIVSVYLYLTEQMINMKTCFRNIVKSSSSGSVIYSRTMFRLLFHSVHIDSVRKF